MRIAILGTGRMGMGLARGWARAGHQVIFGSRDPARAGAVADEIGHGSTVTNHTNAVRMGEVVVLAVPYGTVLGLAAALREDLRGKVVMDITNPMRRLVERDTSGAEETARAIGAGARVVPAFKATFDETLNEPLDPATGLPRDVFICGDDEDAKSIVGGLIGDLGFMPVDCGPLSNAMILDLLVPLIIEVDDRYNSHRASSWKLFGSHGQVADRPAL